MKWADAQQFVEQVQSELTSEIMGLRNPYLVAFGVGAIIVGLGLLIGPFAVLRVAPSEALADFLVQFVGAGLLLIIGGVVGLLSMAMQEK